MLSTEQLAVQLRAGLPQPRNEHWESLSISVQMRDGASLHTRIYKPRGEGAWPVILIRNPYPNLDAFLNTTAIIFNEYGYVVVVQDCRGTGDSEGEWAPFLNERSDGLDTLTWIIRQPWMNGKIGTYGHSYLTAAQWAMADQLPQEVKTMVLSGFTTERYRQNYMNGMFRQDVYTGWALDNAGVEPLYPDDVFQRAAQAKPHLEMDVQVFGAQLPWYRNWIQNSSPVDDYWSKGFWAQLREIPAKVQIPVLMVDGWFDQHVDGMIRDYGKLPLATRETSRFILGPWVHSLTATGDMEFPDNERNLLADALLWFDHQLQGMDYPLAKGIVETYVVGEGRWREWPGWPDFQSKQTWYLSGTTSNGLRLAEQSDAAVEEVMFVYDPHNPVPTRGGAGLLRYLSGAEDAAPPSSVLQMPPGARGDVISFLTEPLDEALCMVGSIVVDLYVSSDVQDTSFSVVLMEALSDGTAVNIRDGITSLSYRNGAVRPVSYKPGSIVHVEISLWPIAWTLRKGSQLRLDISSSNFPAYHAHANMAGPWAEQTESRIARQHIHFGGHYPSRISIPFERR
jgi:putative CocE/NonD family hydrolase